MLSFIRKIRDSATDRGASAVEYALMVAAIAAVIVAVAFGLGRVIGGNFNETCGALNNAPAAAANCEDAPALP